MAEGMRKSPPPILQWAAVVGGGFVAAHSAPLRLSPAGQIVVAGLAAWALGFLWKRRFASGAIWFLAFAVAVALVAPFVSRYAAQQWLISAALAGALAGALEARGTLPRAVDAVVLALALPAGLWLGLAVFIFLNVAAGAIGAAGVPVSLFAAGATAGAVAALIARLPVVWVPRTST